VAYEILTRSSREGYHQQAAHWLMERVADRPEYFGVLADHLARGKQREHALAMYVAAVEDRLQRGLLLDGLRLVESGLAAAREIAREAALPFVSRLWIAQGQTLNELNRYKEALAACQTALMLMQELPSNDFIEERVTAGYTLADAYRKLGQYNESFEALTIAHNLLPSGKSLQLSEIVRSFGALARYRGRLDDGRAYHERALKLAEEAGSRLQAAANVLALGLVALDRGELAAALGHFQRALETDGQGGNVYYQVMDLNYIGMVFHTVCAYEKALEYFNEAQALQQRMHYRDPLLEANRGLCLVALGQSDEGLALLEEASARPHQNAYTQHLVHLARLAGLAQAGQFEACLENAGAFIAEVCERNPILLGRGMLWRGIAQYALGESYAHETVQQALDNELLYGGRDTWLCYYALGRATEDEVQSTEYYANAANILNALTSSLSVQPELKTTFLSDEFAQAVFGYASNNV
jgi:tetratricopeptide (TPR) repeat protein